jgi:hypothetical protein
MLETLLSKVGIGLGILCIPAGIQGFYRAFKYRNTIIEDSLFYVKGKYEVLNEKKYLNLQRILLMSDAIFYVCLSISAITQSDGIFLVLIGFTFGSIKFIIDNLGKQYIKLNSGSKDV